MSEDISTGVQGELASVSPDPSTLPTPTPTHYQQVVAQVSLALDELAKQLPTLEGQHPSTTRFVGNGAAGKDRGADGVVLQVVRGVRECARLLGGRGQPPLLVPAVH